MGQLTKQKGFILIYVVALVAAITIILYQVSLQRESIPRQFERQLNAAIEQQEILSLERHIIESLDDPELPIDPRYLAYRRIQETDPARLGDLADAVKQLQAMLAELNFKIAAPDDPSSSSTKDSITQELGHDGNSTIYQIRKEPYLVKLGGHEYRITVLPANALPNLNSIEYPALWRYLMAALQLKESEAKQLAANLVDWRDPDTIKTDGIGAEQETYQSSGYLPRNGPITHWQELAYLQGMTPDLLQQMKSLFFLGNPAAPARVLPEYTKPEYLAAMADLKKEFVIALLKEYGRYQTEPNAQPQGNSGILYSSDAERFDKVIAWRAIDDQLHIEIAGIDRSSGFDYDRKSKKISNRW